MNDSFTEKRAALLQQMAALDSMELGSLKAEFRTSPSGSKSGPYFKHQVWKDGANQSQRVSTEDAPALQSAIDNRVRFEALAQSFIDLTVEHTRQNRFPDSLKKKDLPCRLAQEAEISDLMATFASRTPTGDAVQKLESLVRTAIFKPATELVGFLLQQAADRIDAAYQPKPGEQSKGRQLLQVQCLFGRFSIVRDYYYDPRRKTGHFPADQSLGLEGAYTPALARLICLEGADEPGFDKAERHLAESGGIHVSARQIQRVVQRVGSGAQAWQERPGALGSTDAPILYVSGDGTGIPMRKEVLAGRRGKQPDGSAKTAQVYLGCVFTQHRCDSEGHPVRDFESTTYVSSLESIDQFGPLLRQEALRRGMGTAAQTVLLIDGAVGLAHMGRDCFKDAIQIVDFFHAMEHAGKVLEALIGKDHPDYKPRLRRWAKRLLRNGVRKLIDESRHESRGRLSEDAVDAALHYFENNVERMQYGTFRQKGYFIGSGVVEAGCKTVIGARCKQSGMRWSETGAENILALRCIHASRRTAEFWKHRLDRHAACNDALTFSA